MVAWQVRAGRWYRRRRRFWRGDGFAVVDGRFSSQITELTSKREQKSRCCFQWSREIGERPLSINGWQMTITLQDSRRLLPAKNSLKTTATTNRSSMACKNTRTASRYSSVNLAVVKYVVGRFPGLSHAEKMATVMLVGWGWRSETFGKGIKGGSE